MKKALALSVLMTVAWFSGQAAAQTLAEVQMVSAATAQLNPAIRLPSGSYRAVGPGAAAFVARLAPADRRGFGEWEVYEATGLTARLQPAYVHQLTAAFAVAGMYQSSRTEKTVAGATHTRYVFEDTTGGRVLLYTIRSSDSFIWVLAKAP